MNTDPKANMNWIPKKWFLNSLGIILIIASFNCTHGQTDAATLFEKANEDYQAGQHAQAIDGYNQVLNLGIENADLYYNLGCAHLKLTELGPAILNFERALEMKPFNRKIRHNLKLAQGLTEDDFSLIQGFFLVRWFEKLTSLFSSNLWAIFSICLFSCTVASIFGWLFFQHLPWKKTAFIIGICCLFLSVGAMVLGNWKSSLEKNNPWAIIMKSETPLLIAPDTASKEILSIHEGLKVKIINQIGDWYKIELTNKEVGWVLQTTLERI